MQSKVNPSWTNDRQRPPIWDSFSSIIGYAELLCRRLEKESPLYNASDIIITQAERMAEIVRKIGKITKYETKSYVGGAKILDLDKATSDVDRKGVER